MWFQAKAHANIALIKYWGKRDKTLNLPQTGSLSLTLDALSTQTKVRFKEDLKNDKITLNGTELGDDAKRPLINFLNIFRTSVGSNLKAEIISDNNFPTASGLASSSSGYAALAKATTMAFDLNTSDKDLSVLARRGSGSAARSVFGGFVEMLPGVLSDGSDAYARPLDSSFHDIAMIICVVGGGKKKDVSSRDAMNHCKATSPYFDSWIKQVPMDLKECKKLLKGDDLEPLGRLVEANALAMHAAAMASRPSTLFFQPQTLALLKTVTEFRKTGMQAYATMDAGPHVKVLCRKSDANALTAKLSNQFPEIKTITAGIGAGVQAT